MQKVSYHQGQLQRSAVVCVYVGCGGVLFSFFFFFLSPFPSLPFPLCKQQKQPLAIYLSILSLLLDFRVRCVCLLFIFAENASFDLFIYFNRGPGGGAAQQAAALRAEGVTVDTGSLGELVIDLGRFGWFPEILPSERGEEAGWVFRGDEFRMAIQNGYHRGGGGNWGGGGGGGGGG